MKILGPICALFLASAATLHADRLIQEGDTLAICGDSITAQHLYSAYLEDYLLMCARPTPGLKIIQFGWGGEQAPGFLARLDTDVFPFKPTVATTCYGMNDGHYAALTDPVADTYRKAQTDIIEAMKKNGVRSIVLGSPKCVDSFAYHNNPAQAAIYNQTLGALAEIDKDIATTEGVVYADVFGATTVAMEKAKAQFGDDYIFAGPDGVHPGPNGQLVMAYAFLKALGYSGNIGKITVDLDHNQAQGTPGQDVESFQDGVVSLKSTRYPFCFTGTADSKDPNANAGILTCVPFNEELNRYILVVTGVKTSARVTWGKNTKEFTADDLKKGINLAAEFIDNPFQTQFRKVHEVVLLQQAQEETLVQHYMHNRKHSQDIVPSAAAAIDQNIEAGMALRKALYQGAVQLVIPVEHTIKIEAD